MKELDLLLERWLQRRWPEATADERARFEALLDLPDPQIARYLLGRETPDDPGFVALLAELRPARS